MKIFMASVALINYVFEKLILKYSWIQVNEWELSVGIWSTYPDKKKL